MANGDDRPVVCPAEIEDTAYIFYTSGTTGNPKGVLLSHKNVLADVDGINQALGLEERQTILCFLPLFHVNAMLTCTFSLQIGLTDRAAQILQRQRILGSGGQIQGQFLVCGSGRLSDPADRSQPPEIST